ncbi:class I SAM-dependent methyltransferase [Actinoallomurus purpureus]|nr:class I SAM-dependent methyltransferase [Actinoallomurus purpureus]
MDSSAGHLRRLREKAEADGVADRVRIVQADLDAEWPDLGTPELVLASASMHHLSDPGRPLRQVHDMLAPDGLFAVVELAGFDSPHSILRRGDLTVHTERTVWAARRP